MALSLVVVVYDMPEQALNTIRSLSPDHQRGVSAEQYEIVVVENESARTLDQDQVQAAAANARYLRRSEPGRSPAAAVNTGADLARGELLAIAVDGARMVTPGVVSGILRAARLAPTPVVSVPGYHLGDQLHQDAVAHGYSVAQEQQMLARLGWRRDGYALFRRAVLSASCADGFLVPIAESNCVAMPRGLFDDLGGFDERFVTSGGGFVNLDFYRRAVDHPGSTLVLLPGEGAFHQFHGGATTGAPNVDRDRLIDDMRAEYRRLRRRDYVSPQTRPILLGEIPPDALPFLAHSVRRAQGTDT
ncbi:MAG: glycosyltransferase [Candidatus Nanopelagicales bacterium]